MFKWSIFLENSDLKNINSYFIRSLKIRELTPLTGLSGSRIANDQKCRTNITGNNQVSEHQSIRKCTVAELPVAVDARFCYAHKYYLIERYLNNCSRNFYYKDSLILNLLKIYHILRKY